jgi:bacterial/archaeal transporter family-2 protein
MVGGLLLSLALAFVPQPTVRALFAEPRWLLSGGLLGPIYVVVLTVATPLVGVGITMVGILCGQVGASLVIDHFGLLGSPRKPINPARVLALLLTPAALWLIR